MPQTKQEQPLFPVATINAEQEVTGKIAAMSTADQQDKHGWVQTTLTQSLPAKA